MTANEKRLLDLIRDRAFKPGSFKLASGSMSEYYIDGKMVEVHPECAFLIGQVLFERTKNLKIDAVGGLEVGAVPLTTALVMTYFQNARNIEGFWVRDEQKAHGTKKLIEGGLGLGKGSKVLILDDVITRGNSALKAVKALEEKGCEVVQILALVDRLEGADLLFKDYIYDSVFTIRDLGVEPNSPGELKHAVSSRKSELVAC